MHDKSFLIKIADLLKNTWSKDSVYLENKFSKELSTSEEGISAHVEVMWLNDSSIMVTLSNIKAVVNKECDRCGNIYQEEILVNELVLKAVAPTGEEDFVGEENEHCIIDTNLWAVDLHDPIVHAIQFCYHVVNNCPDCTKIVESLVDDIEPEIEWKPIVWKKS